MLVHVLVCVWCGVCDVCVCALCVWCVFCVLAVDWGLPYVCMCGCVMYVWSN